MQHEAKITIRFRWTIIVLLASLGGCASGDRGRPVASATTVVAENDEHHGGKMHLYEPEPTDPDWLVKASEFHGHLGPWSTIGAMIGRDAVARLGRPLPWNVVVVCWMPPEMRSPPFSCLIDGLQCGSGATMGKRNSSFSWENSRPPQVWPEIFVAKAAEDGKFAEGLSYCLTPQLRSMIAAATLDNIEALSRQIAAMDSNNLFITRPLTADELRNLGASNISASE